MAALALAAVLPITVQAGDPSASSETSGGGDSSSKDGATALERVIVTSDKRMRLKGEVPSTVSIAQGAALEADGVRDAEGIFRRMPGVQANKGDPDQSIPTIRGVGTVMSASGMGLQQATTGIYIEDVPFSDPISVIATADLAPFDLERVEVLRGPQGALYGSASLGGAVRYLLGKPKATAFEASVQSSVAGVTSGGMDRSVHGMLNLPFELARGGLRVVAYDRTDDGYIDNTGAGRGNANRLRQRGARVSGSMSGDGIRLVTTLLTQQTQVDDSFATDDRTGRLQRSTPTLSSRQTAFSLANVQINFDLGSHVVTSNTGALLKRADASPDQTRRAGDLGGLLGLPNLGLVRGHTLLKGRAYSEELRIASTTNSETSYLVGAFLQRSYLDADAALDAPGGSQQWGSALLPGDKLYREADRGSTSEQAVFGDVEHKLTDEWSVGLGGRWYQNTLHFEADSRLLEALLPPVLVDHRLRERGTTPKASIKYLQGSTMWYASAAKGYRFGGVNPGSGTRYKSDSLWNYETGVRLAPSREVALEASLYRIDWCDAQVNARQGGSVPINGIANVGRARLQGAEGTVQWQFTRELGLQAGASIASARTTTPFVSSNGVTVAAGSRMPGVARLQGYLQADYRFAGPAQSNGRVSMNQTFIGDRTLSLDSGGSVPGFSQLDARVSFSRENWELSLFVNNLGNKLGYSGGSPIATFGGSSYLEYLPIKPRTLGVTLRYDY